MINKLTDNFLVMTSSNLSASLRGGYFFDSGQEQARYISGGKHEDISSRLQRELREYIYTRYYANDTERANEIINGTATAISILDCEESKLGKALAEACSDCRLRDSGWKEIKGLTEEGVVAEKSGVRLLFKNGDFARSPSGAFMALMPAVRRFSLAGWTIALSETPLSKSEKRYWRHYFPVRSSAALVSAFAAIVHYMNERQQPFQLKAINNANRIARNDNLVLFTSASLPPAALTPLYDELIESHRSEMKPPPPLTVLMRGGWGVALDQPSRDASRLSFGQEKCDLVAGALIEAGPDSCQKEKLKLIKRALSANGSISREGAASEASSWQL